MPFRQLLYHGAEVCMVELPDAHVAAKHGLLIRRRRQSSRVLLTNYSAVPVAIKHWEGENFSTRRVPISVSAEAMPHDGVILGDEEYEYLRAKRKVGPM